MVKKLENFIKKFYLLLVFIFYDDNNINFYGYNE